MADLLHIEASPRKTRSASLDAARAFIDAYRLSHPQASIETLDVWRMPLPEFDNDALDAKYAGLSGTPLTPSQQTAWDHVHALAKPLHEAKTLLFSVPLWNFSIPYKLKHFIDVVSQKDVLFSFDPQLGFGGLLAGKRAVVVYARGLDYGKHSNTPAHAFDFQKSFFDAWLRFVGIERVDSIVVEKTLFGPQVDAAAREEARGAAAALARTI